MGQDTAVSSVAGITIKEFSTGVSIDPLNAKIARDGSAQVASRPKRRPGTTVVQNATGSYSHRYSGSDNPYLPVEKG